MVTRKFIYLILIGAFVSSCVLFSDGIPYDKKNLTYKNRFAYNNQFRMDGMYLTKKPYGYYLNYFFQNGYYYNAGIEESDINDKLVNCFVIPQGSGEIPYYWGCFIVEDNILKIQTYTAHLTFGKQKIYERWAEIVNDTTIHFFKHIDVKGKVSSLDETFHFRHCENKPDSTNILMKD